ncbi:MAG: pyridoxal phosphate-dependent aminotransferase [Gammaproteobacteria bacterium]|nr:pyridoxal phosphate-dependent aminotransferase [Gammaproteobacteria bacterium]
MDHLISNRAKQIGPSATLALAAKAGILKAQGKDIVALNLGEPDFDTPEPIKEAAIAAMKAGKTKYTPVEGTLELRKAIVEKFRRENQLDYIPNQILVSNGAKHSIYNALVALINPGDEVIIPAPYWVSYPDMVKLVEGVPVIIHASIQQNFKITPEQLDAAITEKTKLVFFNSPSNPSGKIYSKHDFQALGKVLLKYPHVMILTDDIYEHILWGEEPFSNIVMAVPELYERTIVINSLSKVYAMTGWRMGYTAGAKNVIEVMTTIQSQSTSCPCSISQAAATAALSADMMRFIPPMVESFKQRHDYLYQELSAIDGVQILAGEGTFYALPDVSELIQRMDLKDDMQFAEKLMDQTGLILTPGTPFGAPGCVRFSFASSMEELAKAMARFRSFVCI